ncbi:MAG: hypothetical protein C0402_15945 [Thermodesulfovibrio sp.]|nr:hypothetical protein [Thermodesulfovibrio sp.]
MIFNKNRKKKGYEACSGCGVCLLSCPVWHRTRTMSFTRKARARAMQGGGTYEEIAPAIDSCLLCGACETACPEGIELAELNIHQRQELNRQRTTYPRWYPADSNGMIDSGRRPDEQTLLLAGGLLGSKQALCLSLLEQLGTAGKTALARDDGQDIAKIMEAGLPLSPERVERFVSSLRSARTLIVAEGLLHRPLRAWLPGTKILGPGEALLSDASLRLLLRPEDLYIIEGRGYHTDHRRLAGFYHRLRHETGCYTNLDLQRTAFSTGAASLQGRNNIAAAGCIENAKRILKGKKAGRVVVEDLADSEAFRLATDLPVIHIAQLRRGKLSYED